MPQKRTIRIDSLIYDDEMMEARMKEVGRRIRQERMRQGLSLSKLAERSNLSVGCISKSESAQCRISLKALLKIAAALGRPVRFFLEPEEASREKLTNGERFERITEAAEADAVDFMLDMAGGIMRMIEKDRKK